SKEFPGFVFYYFANSRIWGSAYYGYGMQDTSLIFSI
ncbi:hypothetical protein KIPB_004373, partial [Kipferlia bialata]